MRTISKLFAIGLTLMSALLTACGSKPIQGVIITGQNNHNWPVSSQAIKLTLDNTGMFETDIAVSPATGEDMSSFSVDFSKYKFVVLDYNGADWPEPMQKSFLDFAQVGGAIVIFHAANNSFTNWVEYNRITALGGWEGRTRASGPYTYWKDGGLVK